METYLEIKERFEKQGIDITNKYLLIDNYFNGEKVRPTFSKNKKVVCFPVYDEELSAFYGEQIYTPKCFFVENKYNAWIRHGDVSVNTDVYVLYD